MTNPSGTVENLTKFQPKWKHGKTQTIRVPIALAEKTLALARQLDNGSDSLDTVNNDKLTELYERNGKLTRQCEKLQAESSKLQESLDTAEDTIADLKNEVMVLKADLEKLKEEKPRESLDTVEPAVILNQIKSKNKKSKISLQDIEAILELLPEKEQEQRSPLPDLYAARDRLFQISGWKFERGEKRERFYAFAEALINETLKLNPNYTVYDRLISDLKQATARSEGYCSLLIEKDDLIRKQEVQLGQRKFYR